MCGIRLEDPQREIGIDENYGNQHDSLVPIELKMVVIAHLEKEPPEDDRYYKQQNNLDLDSQKRQLLCPQNHAVNVKEHDDRKENNSREYEQFLD